MADHFLMIVTKSNRISQLVPDMIDKNKLTDVFIFELMLKTTKLALMFD